MATEGTLTPTFSSFVKIVSTLVSDESGYLESPIFTNAEPSSSHAGPHARPRNGGHMTRGAGFDLLWGLLIATVVAIFTFYVSLMCCLLYQRHKTKRRPSDDLPAATRKQPIGRIRGTVRSFAEGMRRQSEAEGGLAHPPNVLNREGRYIRDGEGRASARGSRDTSSSYAIAISEEEHTSDQDVGGSSGAVERS